MVPRQPTVSSIKTAVAMSNCGAAVRLVDGKACHRKEKAMKYLCLVYMNEKDLAAIPDSECIANGEMLRESGHYIAAEALQSVHTATTLRVRNGKVSITDGPFAETKEHLAGFYLIDAKDLNEAVQ